MSPDHPDVVLRYAEHADGILDLHLPGAPNGLVVLLVHGGFWKTAHDRTHTRPMARALAGAGFVVATPEYRRVGPGGSGGWPRTGADVREVAERLPELLRSAGVATGPVRVVGHSAGGHLALWLATTGVPLDRVVALAPVCDLLEAIDRGLGSDAARAFLHDVDPAAADPMTLFANTPETDVRIVHGEDDEPVPIELSRGFVARHPWVSLTEVPGGHFELIEPGSAQWRTVVAALAD
ncbi:MAG: alpha/beta hydrolase [Marmoricola sp.]